MEKFMLAMHDRALVQAARREPGGTPRGVIQLIHGFGEHIGRYGDVMDFFASHGYACVIHDQRGFGEMPHLSRRSARRSRGMAPNYGYFLRDAAMVRKHISRWYPGVPVFLYGHSMGGNIAINLQLKYPRLRYRKVILEAPWLRLHSPPSAFLEKLVRVLGAVSRRFAISAGIDHTKSTRDTARIAVLKEDKITHDRISLRLLAEIVDAGEYAIKNAGRLTIPALLLCPQQDKVVCPEAMLLLRGAPAVTLRTYPDGYHCLHGDIIASRVLGDILGFMK